MKIKTNRNEQAKAIIETLKQYDHYRKNWIKMNGSDQGFDEWFTRKIFITIELPIDNRGQ